MRNELRPKTSESDHHWLESGKSRGNLMQTFRSVEYLAAMGTGDPSVCGKRKQPESKSHCKLDIRARVLEAGYVNLERNAQE